MRWGLLEGRENAGCDSRDLGPLGGVDGADSDSGALSMASSAMMTYSLQFREKLLRDGRPLASPEKGSTCNEQTSLASTPAPRSMAQKSCAPRSRDPSSVVAFSRKSSIEVIKSKGTDS